MVIKYYYLLFPLGPSVGRQNEEQLYAEASTDTFTRFTSPEPGNSQRAGWCQAEGYINSPQPNDL